MKNIDIPIIAIDFEGSRELGIVEYGAAEFFGGQLLRVHTRICRPLSSISKTDAAFFDISDSFAKHQAPFSADIPLFIDLRRRGIFAAHNASVEDSLLRAAAPTPADVPDFISKENCASWAPWLDSYAFCRNIYPQLQSAKLSEAIAELGLLQTLRVAAEKFCPLGRRKWHCALFDAIACGLIYMHTCAQSGFEEVTLAWLGKYSGVKSAEQSDFDSLLK